ncbi:hypothetical protein AMTRI_Chr05g58620 [Amborella trichopoda]
MGRAPCCDKANVKRGPWSPEEDNALRNYVQRYGTGGNWIALPQKAGLKRCGKSCRLRWLNYLRPDIKHGGFTEEEDNIIISLYKTIGSRWSVIASQLPGRTDNDVKNYWNTKLKKKLFGSKPTTPQTSKTPTLSSPSSCSSSSSHSKIPLKKDTTFSHYTDSLSLEKPTSISPTEIPNYAYNVDPQRLVTETMSFAPSNLTEYEVSTASYSQESDYIYWALDGATNGAIEESLLMDYDFINGLLAHEKKPLEVGSVPHSFGSQQGFTYQSLKYS